MAVRLSLPLICALFPTTSLLAQDSVAEKEPEWKRLAAPPIFSEESYDREGMRAAERDAFPVLDHPEMVQAGSITKELDDEEPIIGLFVGGEARAYPISVMGSVELVNDTCGALAVAVSW